MEEIPKTAMACTRLKVVAEAFAIKGTQFVSINYSVRQRSFI